MHYNWKVYGKYRCPICDWLLARRKADHKRAVSICSHCKVEMIEVDPVSLIPIRQPAPEQQEITTKGPARFPGMTPLRRDADDPAMAPATGGKAPQEQHCEHECVCRVYQDFQYPSGCQWAKCPHDTRSCQHTSTPVFNHALFEDRLCQYLAAQFPNMGLMRHNSVHDAIAQIADDCDYAKSDEAALIQRTLDTLWHRMSAYFDGDPAVESLYVNVADLATEIEALRSQPPTTGSTTSPATSWAIKQPDGKITRIHCDAKPSLNDDAIKRGVKVVPVQVRIEEITSPAKGKGGRVSDE